MTLCHADDKPLDFWDEEARLFGTAVPGQHVDASLAEGSGFELDHADHVEGYMRVL